MNVPSFAAWMLRAETKTEALLLFSLVFHSTLHFPSRAALDRSAAVGGALLRFDAAIISILQTRAPIFVG